MLLSRFSPEEKEKIRVKITAHTLMSRKKSFNINRPFLKEYLNKAPSLYIQNYEKFKAKELNGHNVIFADVVQKSNRAGKGYLRILIITDRLIYLLHPDFSSKKPPRNVDEVIGVAVDAGKDNLAVLKTNEGTDYILDFSPCSQQGEKVSEMVTALYMLLKRKGVRQLSVEVLGSGPIDAKTANGVFKVEATKGQTQKNGNALFKASGKTISVIYADV